MDKNYVTRYVVRVQRKQKLRDLSRSAGCYRLRQSICLIALKNVQECLGKFKAILENSTLQIIVGFESLSAHRAKKKKQQLTTT